MSRHPMPLLRLSVVAVIVFGSVAAVAGNVVSKDRDSAAATAAYQQQRAACVAGRTGEDQATCLKEAGAALAETRRGQLKDGHQDLQRNKEERCKALSGNDRSDCIARMRGEGTTEGSVAGGGILREKVTIVPEPANSAKSGTAKQAR